MKPFFSLLLAGTLVVGATGTSEPIINRNMLQPIEKKIDQRLETLYDEPFLLLGLTRGFYVEKFGAVFSAELQLIATPGFGTLGFTSASKELIAATHKKKMERLPALREAMKAQLVAAAQTLDKLPPEERVVLGISLFRRSWEDTTNLPAQIVMQGTRKELLAARTPALMESAIHVQEF